MTRLKRLTSIVATLTLVGITAMPALVSAASRAADSAAAVPRYQHIFQIMMENHSYSEIIGNSYAPHINNLAQRYGLATNYYAVWHPSEPNYVATIGGNYFGISDDAPYWTHAISGPSLASQLERAGLSWKDYQQSMPYAGYLGTAYPSSSDTLYASKHNPFMNFTSVTSNKAELLKNVPIEQLAHDLSSGAVPNFSYIAPDQCHDMHGGPPACPYSNNPGDPQDNFLVQQGDNYVAGLVAMIQSSPVWLQGNTAIVIVWDEDYLDTTAGCCDANPGGGQVAAIVIANRGPRAVQDTTPYNHYSLLQTIQDAFGLGCLQFTCDTTNVTPMRALFATR